MNKTLFVSSEAQPLIKTGGLADVAGALPAALKAAQCDVRLMLPAYADVLTKLGQPQQIASLHLPGLPGSVKLLEARLPVSNVEVILVDYAPAFDRSGNPYLAKDGLPWPDNAERFCLLARAACEVAMNRAGLDWQPDMVHCNDWQTGLIPALLQNEPQRPATLFTIHNLAYQGLFPAETFTQLGLPAHLWSPEALEFHNQLSFIKGGLVFADRITTVSPRYAEEIQTARFGYGLEGLLKYRSGFLSGIINGIDDNEWNPATDTAIAHQYDSKNLDNKQACKSDLQQHFGLPVNNDVMLCGFIGRLVEQKGIDLILEAINALAEETDSASQAIQFVFLGNGERGYETQLLAISKSYPDRIGVMIGYDEKLAHQIEAGADVFMMPSRFEPCGLNQLYSLRYGTLPVVHRVGGLADTVTDTDTQSMARHTATGFVFDTDDSASLLNTIKRAQQLFASQDDWRTVMRNGMNRSFNWQASARHYLSLYQQAIQDLKPDAGTALITPKAATDSATDTARKTVTRKAGKASKKSTGRKAKTASKKSSKTTPKTASRKTTRQNNPPTSQP